jgi:hypothetical protein
LIHKAKTEEPKTVLQQLQTGLTGEEHRSDQCVKTQSGIFEEEDTRRDRMASVETSKTTLEGFVSLVIK